MGSADQSGDKSPHSKEVFRSNEATPSVAPPWSGATSRRFGPLTRQKIKYAILTGAIFLPLLYSFVAIRNVYPFAAWNVMMAPGVLERGRSYWILRGETVSGETIDIRPITLTNA